MLDGIKAGQTIKCTITREPHNRGARVTLLRLMQRDPSIKRALSKAQQLRRRRMHRYIRGNRLYSARERTPSIARVVTGESWEMPYTHDIAPDMAAVGAYLNVEKA